MEFSLQHLKHLSHKEKRHCNPAQFFQLGPQLNWQVKSQKDGSAGKGPTAKFKEWVWPLDHMVGENQFPQVVF